MIKLGYTTYELRIITNENKSKVIGRTIKIIVFILSAIVVNNLRSSLSRWSQLTDKEKDNVRKNTEIYEYIKGQE